MRFFILSLPFVLGALARIPPDRDTLPDVPAHPPPKHLGINCQGSALCLSQGTGEVSRKLTRYINSMNDNTWVNNGAQIACVREPHLGGQNGAICAFMEHTGGAPAKSLKALSQAIVDHGCNKCGGVPLFFPSDNNPDTHGILKFDYVSNGCGKSGVCPGI